MKLFVNFSDFYSVTEHSSDQYYKAENLSLISALYQLIQPNSTLV